MKLGSPLVVKSVGAVGAAVIWLWLKTLRVRHSFHDPACHPASARRYIYSFWHESILGVLRAGAGYWPQFMALISQHRDGELITQAALKLGVAVARGSTTRGGRAGLRSLIRHADSHHLLITPDGPRGPRHKLQPGIVYLASATRLPIIPVGIAYSRARRLNSWDRFALPSPGSTVYCVCGPLIEVPELPGSGGQASVELARWTNLVQEGMDRASDAAGQFALGATQQASRPALHPDPNAE